MSQGAIFSYIGPIFSNITTNSSAAVAYVTTICHILTNRSNFAIYKNLTTSIHRRAPIVTIRNILTIITSRVAPIDTNSCKNNTIYSHGGYPWATNRNNFTMYSTKRGCPLVTIICKINTITT